MIKVTYMSGAGNLFSVIDNRSSEIEYKEYSKLANYFCKINTINSIKTDGLMILENSNQNDLDFNCEFLNPDGTSGMMCGNGGRAISAFYLDKTNTDNVKLKFSMAGSIYNAEILENSIIKLEMDKHKKLSKLNFLEINNKIVNSYFVDVGTEHCIVNINDLNIDSIGEIDINYLGPLIRNNINFNNGANANFFEIKNDKIYLRTYERGVEAETGACGTGTVATALVLNMYYQVPFPIKIIPSSGEMLIVDVDNGKHDTYNKIFLIGPAIILEEKVFQLENL